MVIRCFQCKGLLQVDENNLPPDRRARIRCPHCKGIGVMPDINVNAPAAGSAAPKGSEGSDYPSLLPVEPPKPAQDWKEAAIPKDAFTTFRYPEDREGRQPASKVARRRGLPLWVWVIISVAVVAFFAVLVNIMLPGPAGVKPVVHSVAPEHAGPPKITEENVGARNGRSLPGLQDR